MFFCRDDSAVHPHTLVSSPGTFRRFDWDANRDELLGTYAALFEQATPDQLAFDGSATYLVTRKAPERIAQLTPQARVIALLRNPVDRAHSAYFHQLKNQRAVLSFEDQLKFEPGDILETGCYVRHISRYLRYFPREQLLILPFERFTAEQQATCDQVAEFLGLAKQPIKSELGRTNEALVPFSIAGQRLVNLGLRLTQANFEASAVRRERDPDQRGLAARSIDKALRGLGRWNRGKRPYPDMNPRTRELLQVLYQRENRGLSELAGEDFGRWWPELTGI